MASFKLDRKFKALYFNLVSRCFTYQWTNDKNSLESR